MEQSLPLGKESPAGTREPSPNLIQHHCPIAKGCKHLGPFTAALWRRKWQPTPVFLPGESHGRRSLVGYSPRGLKELNMTERLHFTHSHFKPPLPCFSSFPRDTRSSFLLPLGSPLKTSHLQIEGWSDSPTAIQLRQGQFTCLIQGCPFSYPKQLKTVHSGAPENAVSLLSELLAHHRWEL